MLRPLAAAAAIIENTNGKNTLMGSVKDSVKLLLFRPHKFLGSAQFLAVWGVYSGTYIAANTIDSVCEWMETSPATPKFIGVTAANMGLGIAKDRLFVRIFGLKPPASLPLSSFALFFGRDSVTVGAAFNVPPYVSKALQSSGVVTHERTADNIAQMVSPVLAQLATTPMHLLALDIYNRVGVPSSERVKLVGAKYVESVLARCARILPAFGIGGVANRYIREYLIEVKPK